MYGTGFFFYVVIIPANSQLLSLFSLQTPFVRSACPRNDIVTLLAEVRLLEDGLVDQ